MLVILPVFLCVKPPFQYPTATQPAVSRPGFFTMPPWPSKSPYRWPGDNRLHVPLSLLNIFSILKNVWLVATGTLFFNDFPETVGNGMSSSHLTNSYFSRWLKPPTRCPWIWSMNMVHEYSPWIWSMNMVHEYRWIDVSLVIDICKHVHFLVLYPLLCCFFLNIHIDIHWYP